MRTIAMDHDRDPNEPESKSGIEHFVDGLCYAMAVVGTAYIIAWFWYQMTLPPW